MKRDSFYRELTTSELIGYIIRRYHSSLRVNNPKILLDLKYLTSKYNQESISVIQELYIKFDELIIKHIDREEKVFFKAIKKLENTIELCKNVDPESINDCKMFIEKQEDEHMKIEEILLSIQKLTIDLKAIDDPRYYEFIHMTNRIIYETKDHSKVEDFYLNEKIKFYLDII